MAHAKRLRFIQSIGAGTDQFSREALKQHGVRLASARGVNARAVSEHLMALMLEFARRLPEARDNQARRVWRGMIGDLAQREDELGGKTLLIVGLGQIGGRLAQLAKAFDMRVIGIRRDPRAGAGHADAVHAMSGLNALLRDEDHAREFLKRHQDKLLFGSDCVDHDGGGDKCYCALQQATVRRLAPDAQAVRKMLYGNASRTLKIV